jgi:hypothetical protein
MPKHQDALQLFEPPTTHDEIHAAVQYVRKVSGMQKPSCANEAAFERAVQIAHVTEHLLARRHDRPAARPRGRGGQAASPGRRASRLAATVRARRRTVSATNSRQETPGRSAP